MGSGGSFRTSEGNTATGAKKAKQRELTTVIAAYKHSPAKKLFAHPPQGVDVGANAWGSDSRERTGGWLSEDSLRSPRKKPWPIKEARDHR